ncbi:hypothetical protein [Trinickia dinghuensis]|nr:hypothetical protein [Trinickia dinghuensis]
MPDQVTALDATDWYQHRHFAELHVGRRDTSLTAAEFGEFMRWRDLLRVLPTMPNFPSGYTSLPAPDGSLAALIDVSLAVA